MTMLATRRVKACLLAATGGVLLLASASAARDELRLGTGLDYSNGDYGETTDTTIVTVPFSAAWVTPRWSFSATLPFVSVEGPGVIVPGGGAIGGGVGGSGPGSSGGGPSGLLDGGLGLVDSLIFGAQTPTSPGAPPPPPPPPGAPAATAVQISESGVGDGTLSASFAPVDTDGGLRLTLSSGLRVPTGDEDKSLGTGETAGSLSAGLSQRFGRSAVYGVVGVQRAFESEVEGMFGGVGLEGYVSDRTLLGASFNWAEASDDRFRDASQASAYAGFDVNPNLQLRAYGSAGLTDSSPDVGAGVRIVFKQPAR